MIVDKYWFTVKFRINLVEIVITIVKPRRKPESSCLWLRWRRSTEGDGPETAKWVPPTMVYSNQTQKKTKKFLPLLRWRRSTEGDGLERVKWVTPVMVAKDEATMGLAAFRVPPPPAEVVEVVISVVISTARSTSGQPQRSLSTTIFSHRSSGNAKAPGPWQHISSTLIATLMQIRERERDERERNVREEFIFLNSVKRLVWFNFRLA